MRNKKPTLREKVQKYESLLHLLQMHYAVALNSGNVKKLLDNISSWSYAHRVGNGQLSERQQNQLIRERFWKLDKID